MSGLRLGVTTSRDADPDTAAHARDCARRWGAPFLARGRQSTAELLKHARPLIVFAREAVELADEEGTFRFSLGMAKLRLDRLAEGDGANPDRLVRAAELKPGDAFLDCTLGLGQDALVAARAVGPRGRVVALEASLPIFAVVSEGLARWPRLAGSARVETLHARALEHLRALPEKSFDVVYFDPMFDRPRRANAGFDVLRKYADPSPLTPEVLHEARRVSRRWVLVKSARYSPQLVSLGLREVPGSRYADVVFATLP